MGGAIDEGCSTMLLKCSGGAIERFVNARVGMGLEVAEGFFSGGIGARYTHGQSLTHIAWSTMKEELLQCWHAGMKNAGIHCARMSAAASPLSSSATAPKNQAEPVLVGSSP